MNIYAKRKKRTHLKFNRSLHKFNDGSYAADYHIFELCKRENNKYVWKRIRVLRYKFDFDNELFNQVEITLPQSRRFQYADKFKYLIFKEEDLNECASNP